jgi:hypothetical protein
MSVPAGRLILLIPIQKWMNDSIVPTGREIMGRREQAVNDLPKFSRLFETKSIAHLMSGAWAEASD